MNIYYFSQPGMELNIIPRVGRKSIDLNIVPRLSRRAKNSQKHKMWIENGYENQYMGVIPELSLGKILLLLKVEPVHGCDWATSACDWATYVLANLQERLPGRYSGLWE